MSYYKNLMLKVIYFDLGGVTFLDFYSGGDVLIAKALSLPVSEVNRVHDTFASLESMDYALGKMSDEERWGKFLAKLNLPEDKLQTCLDAFYETYRPINETVDLIKKLANQKVLRLGVLSDQPIGVCQFLRKKFPAVFALFDSELTLISAEVGFSKLDPTLAFYQTAIKRAGVAPSEILFVDNAAKNIKNASSLGINTFYLGLAQLTNV